MLCTEEGLTTIILLKKVCTVMLGTMGLSVCQIVFINLQFEGESNVPNLALLIV